LIITGQTGTGKTWLGCAFGHLVGEIVVWPDAIDLGICPSTIAEVAVATFEPSDRRQLDTNETLLVLSVPARLKRVGIETKLLIEGPTAPGLFNADLLVGRVPGSGWNKLIPSATIV
jgi:hypothetical protein